MSSQPNPTLSPDINIKTINRRLSLAALVNKDNANTGNSAQTSPAQFVKLVPSFVSKHVRNYIDNQIERNDMPPSSKMNSDGSSSLPIPIELSFTKIQIGIENSNTVLDPGEVNLLDVQDPKSFSKGRRVSKVNIKNITQQLQPTAIEGWAAVVMCDVSGYSALTAFLADRGPDGAETLSKIMREYINKIIQVVSLHGGDIVKFVGDAVIISWEYTPPTKSWLMFAKHTLEQAHPEWTTEKLAENLILAEQQRRGLTIIKAVECCLDVMAKLNNHRIEIPLNRLDPTSTVSQRVLKIHMGIGAGKIYNVHVGGYPGRWEHLIVGNAMDQIAQILDLAKPGQVAMSRQAFEAMKSCLDLSQVSIEYDSKKCIILNSLAKTAVNTLVPENDDECGDFLALWDIQYVEHDRNSYVDIYKEYVAQSALFKLEVDIQSVGPFHTNQGVNHLMSLNELRQVTTLFIKIGSLSFATVDALEDNIKEQEDYIQEQSNQLKILEANFVSASPGCDLEQLAATITASTNALEASKVALADLQISHNHELKHSISQCQTAITSVQIALKKYEGILRQFHVDDKGAVILAFFGLPPLAHKNDSSLGIQAGLFICDEFKKHFDMFSLGITTGVIAIGGVGSSLRTEYALMGDSLNMAARIMNLPDAKLNLVCDERTYTQCQTGFEFQDLGQVSVKGKSVPIKIYRPIQPSMLQHENTIKPRNLTEMIGRHSERKVVKKLLEDQSDNRRILVEGESGQGVSTFGSWIMGTAESMGYNICVATSVESERSTPYFALRGICRDLICTLGKSQLPTGNILEVPSLQEIPSHSHRSLLACDIMNHSHVIISGSSKSIKSSIPLVVKSGSIKPVTDSNDHTNSTSGVMNIGSSKANVMTNFEKEVREALSISPKYLSLIHSLALVFPEEFAAQYVELATTEASPNTICPQQDLSTLISLVTESLSSFSRTLFLLPDTHYMDLASWEVLMQLADKCPKVLVVTLSYPVKHLLPAIVPFYKSFSNGATIIQIMSLTVSEVSDVIIQTYQRQLTQMNSKKVSMDLGIDNMPITVNPAIYDKVATISGGNPLFVVSLVMSMMEKDSLKIGANGVLTVFNLDGTESGSNLLIDDIIPGSDLHSLIISQFDKLDPMFQVFLKFASVLGQNFLLGDALDYFEMEQTKSSTGSDGSESSFDPGPEFNTQVSDALINDLNKFDKFSFLTFHGSSPIESTEKNVLVSFKNTIIRDAIYTTMLLGQRQSLHLSFARFYERRLGQIDGRSGFLVSQKSTGSTENQLIIKVFEHYQKVQGYPEKKLTYLEQVAHLCYIMGSTNESIRYYQDLLHMPQIATWTVRQPILPLSKGYVLTSVQRSRWHCEMGDALVLLHKLNEAEKQYLEALRWVGFQIPKQNWRLALCTFIEYMKLNLNRIAGLAQKMNKIESELGNLPGSKKYVETRSFCLDATIMSFVELQMVREKDKLCEYLLLAANNMKHGRPSVCLSAALLARLGFYMYSSGKYYQKAVFCIDKALEMIENYARVNFNGPSSIFVLRGQSPSLAETIGTINTKDKSNSPTFTPTNNRILDYSGNLFSRAQRLHGDAGDRLYVVMVFSNAMLLKVIQGDYSKAREYGQHAIKLLNPDCSKNVIVKVRQTMLLIDLLDGHLADCIGMANDMWIISKDRNCEGRFWSLAMLFMLEITLRGPQMYQESTFEHCMTKMRQRIEMDTREYDQEPIVPGHCLVQAWVDMELEFWSRLTSSNSSPKITCTCTEKNKILKNPLKSTIGKADSYLCDRVTLFTELSSQLTLSHFHALIGFMGMAHLIGFAYETNLINIFGDTNNLLRMLKAMRLTLQKEFSRVSWTHWLLVLITGLCGFITGDHVRALHYWDKELDQAAKSNAKISSIKGAIDSANNIELKHIWLAKLVATNARYYAKMNNVVLPFESTWMDHFTSVPSQSIVGLADPAISGKLPITTNFVST